MQGMTGAGDLGAMPGALDGIQGVMGGGGLHGMAMRGIGRGRGRGRGRGMANMMGGLGMDVMGGAGMLNGLPFMFGNGGM